MNSGAMKLKSCAETATAAIHEVSMAIVGAQSKARLHSMSMNVVHGGRMEEYRIGNLAVTIAVDDAVMSVEVRGFV